MVFDVCNKSSFDHLTTWRDEFIVQAGPSDPDTFPFVVLGNKVDLDSSRVIDKKTAEEWAKQRGNIPYFEVSAKDGMGVEQAFEKIAKNALGRETDDDV